MLFVFVLNCCPYFRRTVINKRSANQQHTNDTTVEIVVTILKFKQSPVCGVESENLQKLKLSYFPKLIRNIIKKKCSPILSKKNDSLSDVESNMKSFSL